jgi:uncharacterized protein YwgA
MPAVNEKTDMILLLLYSPGVQGRIDESIDGRVRLMNGLFLMSKELEFFKESYEFVPYLYGPISFDVYSDLAKLIYKGLVVDDKTKEPQAGYYYLTNEGRKKAESLFNSLSPEVQENIKKIKSLTNQKPLTRLLKYIHSKYPQYCIEIRIGKNRKV